MSSNADASAAQIVALFQSLCVAYCPGLSGMRLLTPLNSYSDNYCNVAASGACYTLHVGRLSISHSLAIVLFIYETCLTLDREVAYLWSAKRTGASLLFFANKWLSMTVYIMMLAEFASFPSDKVRSLNQCRSKSDRKQRSVYSIAACKELRDNHSRRQLFQFPSGGIRSRSAAVRSLGK